MVTRLSVPSQNDQRERKLLQAEKTSLEKDNFDKSCQYCEPSRLLPYLTDSGNGVCRKIRWESLMYEFIETKKTQTMKHSWYQSTYIASQ